MAVNNYSGLTISNPQVGIQITKVTDSSSDWTSVSSSTYFYDKGDQLVHYKDSAGNIVDLFSTSASFAATASYLTGTVTSASYSQTASYLNTLNQDLTFNGNLTLNGTASIQYLHVTYETASVILSTGSNQLGDAVSDTQTLIGSVNVSGSLNMTGSLNAPNITGSLQGTASWSNNAQTASYVTTAQTASYVLNAISSSFATTAQTASYVLNSVSASFAATASYVLQSVSASFATSASRSVSASRADSAVSSSYALTASYVANASSFPYTGSAIITGSLGVTGSVSVTQNITASRMLVSATDGTTNGSTLIAYGSGSANPIITVSGSSGELFSVTDSLSGSLLAVNNSASATIFQVNSDNTVLLGLPTSPALFTTNKVTTAATSFVVYNGIPTASYDGAWFEYAARSGSNARAGSIVAIWSGSSVNYTETATTDFGITSDLAFKVLITGSSMALTGSSTNTGWSIKTIIRSI